jgi:hypothetical protein
MLESELASPVLNVLLVAFVSLFLEQIMHEVSHGLTASAVGARWEKLYFWAADWDWPTGEVSEHGWRSAAIAASGALLNLFVALVCILLFNRVGSEQGFLRLFLFFLGAYSLFSAFGYFFFDPIFARPDSPGDLATIVMLLGGGWLVRVPLILIGAAGTLYGYFWMGEAAMQFTTSAVESKITVGFILCVLPYLTNNLIFSLLAWFHPLGKNGFVATILKLWCGFLGFILAFMINFVWSEPSGSYLNETLMPQQLSRAWLVVGVVCVIATLVLLRGLNTHRLSARKH